MSRRKSGSAKRGRRGGEGQTRTPYHAALYQLLSQLLKPHFEVQAEYLLYREPQRIDILVVRREGALPKVGVDELPSLVSHLGDLTLIEFKGPTDVLSEEDVSKLLGYACQYSVKEGRGPEDLTLSMIGPTISEKVVKRVEGLGGSLGRVSEGVWEGKLGGSRLFGLETSSVWKQNERERLWYVLSPGFLGGKARPKELTEGQLLVYLKMLSWMVKQSEEERMNLTNYEFLKGEVEQLVKDYLPKLSAEARLAGLPAEERLAGLPAEVRLAGLPAEVRLAGLPAEARLAGLPAEARLAGLPAEARLAGLPAEARLAGLPAEARLAGLPAEERLAGLPAEARLAGLPAEEVLKALSPEVLALLKSTLN